MTKIYTLTLAPSLDSATLTPQMYPEGKLRCSAPVFEPGGGGINVARAITFLGGNATAIYPAGGATANTLRRYSLQNRSRLSLSKRKTGRGKICMCTWAPAANNTAS